MDNYDLEEVKMIIQEERLSSNILKSILENTTRRIEIYADEESYEILKYILNEAQIDTDTKEEIEKYLNRCKNDTVESIQTEEENESTLPWIFIISGIIFLLLGVFKIILEIL